MSVSRLLLTRAEPAVLEQYGAQTRQAVADLAGALHELFLAEQAGRVGQTWAAKLIPLFALWCEQSGIASPAAARTRLAEIETPNVTEVRQAVRNDLGFPKELSEEEAEGFVAALHGETERGEAEEALVSRLYKMHVRSLCMQSAHVALARSVFYRVMEDSGLAQERISGQSLARTLEQAGERLVGTAATPVQRMLEDMRASMESFLPLLYGLRELDWWLVTAPLTANQQAVADRLLQPVELELQRLLGLLDGYGFSSVDRDVWKDIYQHHLPWEERQRLGGFYTPDALVELILDLAGWTVDGDDLLSKSLIDLSTGSGTFPVEALRRRREQAVARRQLGKDPSPEELDRLFDGIVCLDVHPFATFLATTNLVFQVIDAYESVRGRHPDYRLPLSVFTVDSLEEHGLHSRQAALREKIPEDIRLHHTEEEIKRYQELLDRRFDFAVGNPPWGGVLKGRLSPLADPDKRSGYRESGRFESATGKFDIYVLFIERALHWLADGGTYALVTPNSFRDRGFGEGIRGLLAREAVPATIVDLGPYGNLLFKAMNTPAVTVGHKGADAETMRVVTVNKGYPFIAASGEPGGRQRELTQAAANALLDGRSSDRVTVFEVGAEEIREWDSAPWPLHPLREHRPTISASGDARCGEIFEPLQGVTPGGEGALEVFQMEADEAAKLKLERELVHPAVKGLDLTRWRAQATSTVMLYPYVMGADGSWHPAFEVSGRNPADGLEPHPRSDEEKRAVAGLADHDARRRLLTRRVASGECPHPNAAERLMNEYELLASRRPKGKGITEYGRRWWEYLWPRDQAQMLATPKLISPRLTRRPRFALDEDGLLPTDSCVAITAPQSPAGRRLLADLVQKLEAAFGRPPDHRELLIYSMAFLNSSVAAFMLRVGRQPTAKGSWNIDEGYLRQIPIAVPDSDLASEILGVAEQCADLVRQGEAVSELEGRLDGLVLSALGLTGTATGEAIAAWAVAEED